jgi:hypothetical protein
LTIHKRLLAKGIFPKELPPAFESSKYAKAIEQVGFSPSSFPALPHGSLSYHSLARTGGVRRLLAFANPIAHFRLADEMAQNWTVLRQHFSQPGFGLRDQRCVTLWGEPSALPSPLRTAEVKSAHSSARSLCTTG